jgi:predicted alpha/beta superfamily hydrolase
MFQTRVFISLLVLSCQIGFGQEYLIKGEVVHSLHLGADRTIHVCLPTSYEKETSRRYPVLYLHDGQNIFSTAGTNIAFGWGSWQLDKTADNLARAGKMQEIIIVAVDNSPDRHQEYYGNFDLFQTNTTTTRPTPFENYAAFLVTELKPQIDREYRTKYDAANTGIMGSSLGGICSVELAWEHPEIFGRAASLSGSFSMDHSNFLNDVLKKYRGKPKLFWIYLDSGVVDYTGGDDNRFSTAQVAAELLRIGWQDHLLLYVDDQPLTTEQLKSTGLRQDKWKEAQTSQHNEFYWRLRAWRALTFLFPPDKK